MFEIELKGRVANRKITIQKLNSFANFFGAVLKEDFYFRLEHTPPLTVRLRKEERREGDFDFAKSKLISKKNFLTYKKKERRTTCGVASEVNEEFETEISSFECVEKLLEEIGFRLHFQKRKETLVWKIDFPAEKNFQNATLELCTVEPLGDFLEIEILSATQEESVVKKIRSCLEELLLKAGLALSDVEKKYYSELLEEKKCL